jgi:hypothetical protein
LLGLFFASSTLAQFLFHNLQFLPVSVFFSQAFPLLPLSSLLPFPVNLLSSQLLIRSFPIEIEVPLPALHNGHFAT